MTSFQLVFQGGPGSRHSEYHRSSFENEPHIGARPAVRRDDVPDDGGQSIVRRGDISKTRAAGSSPPNLVEPPHHRSSRLKQYGTETCDCSPALLDGRARGSEARADHRERDPIIEPQPRRSGPHSRTVLAEDAPCGLALLRRHARRAARGGTRTGRRGSTDSSSTEDRHCGSTEPLEISPTPARQPTAGSHARLGSSTSQSSNIALPRRVNRHPPSRSSGRSPGTGRSAWEAGEGEHSTSGLAFASYGRGGSVRPGGPGQTAARWVFRARREQLTAITARDSVLSVPGSPVWFPGMDAD